MGISIDLKCPWNEWKPCFKSECPFYGQTGVQRSDKTGHLELIYSCTRPDKELKEKKK